MVSAEDSKAYYTRLTDTLRKYIEERYGFNAMEMTSSEIIEKLTATQDEKALSELRHLFLTADLVKFAKYSTLINENDMNLVNAIAFIDQTKLENVPVEETIKPQTATDRGRPAFTEGTSRAEDGDYPSGYRQCTALCLRGLYAVSVIVLNETKWNLPIRNICYCSCSSFRI